ncbi:MAG: oligosaccharide flippase family protein [Candidatus Eisenbacteria bacterium]|jgi:O-antigen/teichoic acid export membrane protein|nr:oligosaccharide flippase family protein [Candidatus Eisenbacteria bacterium]
MANLAFVAVAARRLGVADFGLYSIAMTFALFARTISLMGFPQVIIRDVAQHRERAGRYLFSGIALTVPVALLVWALLPVAASVAGYGPQMKSLLWLTGAILVGATIQGLAEAIARAFERMTTLGVFRIAVSMTTAAAGIILVLSGARVRALVALQVASVSLEACALVLLVHRRVTPLAGLPSRPAMSALLRDGFVLFALSVLDLAMRRVDVLLLARLSGAEAVGLYMPGLRLIEYAGILRMSALGALFPFLSARWQESPEVAARGYNDALNAFALVVFGLAVTLSFGAESIIGLLLGEVYLPAASVLRILAWSLVATVLSGPVLMIVIISRRGIGAFVAVAGAEAVVKTVLCGLLIPGGAQIGAAWAACGGAVFSLVVRTWWIRDLLGPAKRPLAKTAARPAFAALVAAAVYALLDGTTFWVALVPATAGYVVTLQLLGAVSIFSGVHAHSSVKSP